MINLLFIDVSMRPCQKMYRGRPRTSSTDHWDTELAYMSERCRWRLAHSHAVTANLKLKVTRRPTVECRDAVTVARAHGVELLLLAVAQAEPQT